jgi:hypothetical protein
MTGPDSEEGARRSCLIFASTHTELGTAQGFEESPRFSNPLLEPPRNHLIGGLTLRNELPVRAKYL